jgi:putative photosynthetic complex assembly protein 2
MSLSALWPAILYTLFLWWVSTGAILWLVRRPRWTFPWTFGAATVVAAGCIWGLFALRGDTSPAGAYFAFTAALGIWGWHEMSFLMGYVLGPRTTGCPPGSRGWRRFRLAALTLIYHEAALAVTAAGLLALSWGEPNPIGAWTFLVLFAMRLSAKLNLFFGVPNLSQEYFPAQLQHLKSYAPTRGASALMPVSILLSAALAAVLLQAALGEDATALEIAGLGLLFALTVLALIEHLFMIVPLADTALWRWAMPAAPAAGAAAHTPLPTDDAGPRAQ